MWNTKKFQSIRKRLESWIFGSEQKTLDTTHLCAIAIYPDHFSLVYYKTGTPPEILLTITESWSTLSQLETNLKKMQQQYHLDNVPCYWMLTPDDYQLFLIEALPVEQKELDAALDWRIRSLSNVPPEDLVHDYFSMPAKKATANQPIIAAAITKKSFIKPKLEVLENAGLRIKSITIPELAMCHLVSDKQQGEESIAFIYVQDDVVILNIIRQNFLYFTRHLNSLPKESEDEEVYRQLSLDILRYLDFFRIQWRLPSPAHIYLVSNDENRRTLSDKLSKLLMQNVEWLMLQVREEDKVQSISPEYLLLLGSSLSDNDITTHQEINFYKKFQKTPVFQDYFSLPYFYRYLAGFAVLCFLLWLGNIWHTHNLKVQVRELKVERDQLQRNFIALRQNYPSLLFDEKPSISLGKFAEQLRHQEQIMETIVNRIRFSAVLDNLARTITRDVWLTDITVSALDKHIQLKGHTLDIESLRDFIRHLNEEKMYANYHFVLKNLINQEEEKNQTGIMDFELDLARKTQQ